MILAVGFPKSCVHWVLAWDLRLKETDPCSGLPDHINPSVYLNLFYPSQIKRRKIKKFGRNSTKMRKLFNKKNKFNKDEKIIHKFSQI